MKQEFEDNGIPPDIMMPDSLPTEEGNLTEGEETSFGLAQILQEVPYPATREDIIDFVTDRDAGPEVLEMLEQLPDTAYNSPTDVSQALGEND